MATIKLLIKLYYLKNKFMKNIIHIMRAYLIKK